MDPMESEADYEGLQQIGEPDIGRCQGCGEPLDIEDPQDNEGYCISCDAEFARAAACGEAPEL